MIFAVSNIAWRFQDRHEAYALLADNQITGLEIAPPLLFADAEDPFCPDMASFKRAMGEIKAAGLNLVSMQSLLFGVEDAAVFGSAEQRLNTRRGLQRSIELAGRMGIRNLVFGSPRQRVVPEGMPIGQAHAIATEYFSDLGDSAAAEGTNLALEANPEVYGTNFLTTGHAALEFVRTLGHKAVLFNLDLGELQVNGTFDQIGNLVDQSGPWLSHVHISEPDLSPAPANAETVKALLPELEASSYEHAVSIEMKSHEDKSLNVLQRSLQLFSSARNAVGVD